MELFPSIKLRRQALAAPGNDRTFRLNEDRLIAVSSWMMVLGTIRFLCGFADYLNAFLGASRFEPVSLRMLGRFFEENQPVLAISVGWPLLIAIVVRRTRWPELLLAAGVTFSILALGGVLEVIAEWNYARGDGITVGSFQLTRRALLHPTLSDLTLGLLGASQLMAEFATALRCLQLAHYLRAARGHHAESDRHEGARRARLGRLAVYASLGFLALMIRLPVWSTYLEILNDSRIIREFVLKNDLRRINGPPRVRPATKAEQQVRDLHMLLGAGFIAMNSTRYLEAKEAYLRIIARAESAAQEPLPPGSSVVVAEAENNLAWLLATCPATELRDPPQAVIHAQRAIELAPGQGNFWNTLGVAFYRDGQYDAANDALHRSIELRTNGDSFDWFFLALVELKQGHKTQAEEWFGKAVNWYQTSRPNDEELRRFHVEAATALGVSAPSRRRESTSRARGR
jgi:tetratricopeptide (TPR) repeat protein